MVWPKPPTNGLNHGLNQCFRTASGFQTNRLNHWFRRFLIDRFDMWIATPNATLWSGKTSAAGRHKIHRYPHFKHVSYGLLDVLVVSDL